MEMISSTPYEWGKTSLEGDHESRLRLNIQYSGLLWPTESQEGV